MSGIDMKNESMILFKQVRELILSSRRVAARGINTLQVLINFEIGRLIVEHEQYGKKRADYGQKLIVELSKKLSEEFGKGFSKSNLEYMRRFFIEYRERITEIYPDSVWGIDREGLEKPDSVWGIIGQTT